MNKKLVIIGAGIGGLGAAGLFAKKGYDVTVVEKRTRILDFVGIHYHLRDFDDVKAARGF